MALAKIYDDFIYFCSCYNEKYLYKFSDIVRLYLKNTYPKPKTNDFIVMAKYNQMFYSMANST